MLASTSLAVFAVFLDTTILFVAFPSISADFSGVSASTLSWVLNAYTIVFAALLIPAGRLADRVGRRRTFLTAVVVFTVASMLCGLAPTAGLLVAARVLQAVGAAALVPASLALVLQTFPREKVPVAVAIWGAIGAVAGAFGPDARRARRREPRLAVGVLHQPAGRDRQLRARPARAARGPGGEPGPPARSARRRAARRGPRAGRVRHRQDRRVGMGQHDLRRRPLQCRAVLIAVFVWRCSRVPNPLLDLSLFDSQSFRWANAAMLVYAIGFNAMFLGNVLFLTEVWHYSILRAGLAISVGPLIVAVTAPFFGRLAGRIGQRALLMPGGLVWASGGVLLLLAGDHREQLPRRLPAGGRPHRPRRRAGAAAAVVGRRAGPARRPVRLGLGGEPGGAQPRRDARRRARRRLHGRRDSRDGARRFHRVWWLLVGCGLVVSVLATRLPRRITAAKPAALVELAAA